MATYHQTPELLRKSTTQERFGMVISLSLIIGFVVVLTIPPLYLGKMSPTHFVLIWVCALILLAFAYADAFIVKKGRDLDQLEVGKDSMTIFSKNGQRVISYTSMERCTVHSGKDGAVRTIYISLKPPDDRVAGKPVIDVFEGYGDMEVLTRELGTRLEDAGVGVRFQSDIDTPMKQQTKMLLVRTLALLVLYLSLMGALILFLILAGQGWFALPAALVYWGTLWLWWSWRNKIRWGTGLIFIVFGMMLGLFAYFK